MVVGKMRLWYMVIICSILFGIYGTYASFQLMDRLDVEDLEDRKEALSLEIQTLVNEAALSNPDAWRHCQLMKEAQTINPFYSFEDCINEFFPDLLPELDRLGQELEQTQKELNSYLYK